MSDVTRNTVYQTHFDHLLEYIREAKTSKWTDGISLSVDEYVKELIDNHTYHFGGPKGSGRTTFIANLVNEEYPEQLLYLSQTKADCDMFAVEFKHIRPGVGLPRMHFGPLPDNKEDEVCCEEWSYDRELKYVIIDHADSYKGVNARQDGLYKTYRALWVGIKGVCMNTKIIHMH